jgi:hypothetical protein
MAARLGGDEFAVIQFLSDFNQAPALAERLCHALALPFAITRATLVIGATIGIARGRRDGAQAIELMKAADLALYATKSLERGAFRIYDPLMAGLVWARLRIEMGLRTALENEEFCLIYQPINSVASGAGIRGACAMAPARRDDDLALGIHPRGRRTRADRRNRRLGSQSRLRGSRPRRRTSTSPSTPPPHSSKAPITPRPFGTRSPSRVWRRIACTSKSPSRC